ncbi:MAG: SGNH/GDSL hydrolase family protein [Spirochaetia bacterium]|nr:SGNH/GDSL hydrolase family protein [Spirochaetia bacterium]
METVRIFGDSIMKRVVYNESDNRYRMLPVEAVNDFGSRLGLEIINSTIFGCTIGKGMQLLQRALTKGLTCDYVLLEFGGNDCDFLWQEVALKPTEDHQPKTPLDEFNETLKSMISLLIDRGIKPLLTTLPPIDAERYLSHICRDGLNRKNILSWLTDIKAIERFQELYSLQIAKIALETSTRLIDIRSGFLKRKDCGSLICEDGIHPNEQGHELILELLEDYREKHTPHYIENLSQTI